MKTNTGRGVENIGYDTRNLPLSMQLDNGLQGIYRYNAAGWRTLKKVDDDGVTSVEEHYILDGGAILAVTDASGNVQFWNMYGNGLIGRREAGGAKKYYVRDHLGSTRQVINGSGTLLEYYDYYPFGLALRSNIAGQQTKETFTGKEQDPATGYYYFGARYYDAALGGWLATDPAGQFTSPYVYAGNPVAFVDQDGQLAFLPALIGAVLGGAYAGYIANQSYEYSGGDWIYTAINTFVQTAKAGIYAAAGHGFATAGKAAGLSSLEQTGLFVTANAGLEAGSTAASGGSGSEIARSAIAGSFHGLFSATGGFGLIDEGFLGRLGYQLIGTSSYSIGQNWVYDRPLLSEVTFGVGPVNLTYKDGRIKYLARENIGNLVAHGIGFGNVLFGGDVKVHPEHLAFEFSGGALEKIYRGWTGTYAILGNNFTAGDVTSHELRHVWQSRAFYRHYVPLWTLSGLYSVFNGYHFNKFRWGHQTINFFELQAEGY